jgi:hypothetical protein
MPYHEDKAAWINSAISAKYTPLSLILPAILRVLSSQNVALQFIPWITADEQKIT